MTTLRIAVRKFEPFRVAFERQFADFIDATGSDTQLYIEQMDLNALHGELFARRGLASGGWDIALLSTDWVAEAQAEGLIENLVPYMERAPVEDFPEAWSQSLLQLQSFSDGFWGMPYHDGPECLIYRKDLFDEHGIEVPRTWNEFQAVARRLHQPEQGRYGTVLALFPDGHNSFYDFCIHVWSRGGSPFDADARPTLISAVAVDALDFIRELAGDTHAIAPNARELDSVKAGVLFCEGKVAMMTNWFGFAALGDTSDQSKVRGKIGVAPIPAGDRGSSVSLNVFWVTSLASGSSHKDLAWAFMRHLTTAPMDKITTLEGGIGVRRSTWNDAEVNRIVPYCHRLDDLHGRACELPIHPRLAQISHIIDDMMLEAVTTDTSSSDLLQAAQSRIEKQFE